MFTAATAANPEMIETLPKVCIVVCCEEREAVILVVNSRPSNLLLTLFALSPTDYSSQGLDSPYSIKVIVVMTVDKARRCGGGDCRSKFGVGRRRFELAGEVTAVRGQKLKSPINLWDT